MKTTTKRMIVLAGALALGLTAVRAQSDGALLDALVRKGVLSDKEAEDIRASDLKEYNTTPAGKLALSDHISQLKLYGDARFRFEYIDETPQVDNHSNDNIVERNRYRLRVGADYTFTDNFKAGFELETSNAGDSANQSFGNGFSKESINVGLIYLQWKPVDWLTLTGGKQRNPLYSTDLEWDPDINPEGGSEVFSFHPTDNLSIGLTAAQFLYADNQEFNGPSSTITPTGVAGSPVAVTSGTTTTLPVRADNHDVWMFIEQVPIQYNFNKDTYVKEVPGFTAYMNGGTTGLPSGFTNGTAGGTGWTGGDTLSFYGPNVADDLAIFTAPGEADWKIGNIPVRAYWDFALNTEGKDRVQDVYFGNDEAPVSTTTTTKTTTVATGHTVTTTVVTTKNANAATQAGNRDLGDNVAWLAGLQVGQNKKKGDWSIRGDFRQVGLGSIDPNTNDSDWGDSFLNQQGIKIQSTYNFTDFLTGSVTFYDTWAYKSGLLDGSASEKPGSLPISGSGTAGTSTTTTTYGAGTIINTTKTTTGTGYAVGGATTGITGLVGASTTQRLQVDLQWKF